MKTLNLLVGACIVLAASQVFAQSALNDGHRKSMAALVEDGKKCVEGLEADDLKPFLKPSPAVKAVLLTEAVKLQGSEEFKKLNNQERKVVVDLLRTARACRSHMRHLEGLSTDLASKEEALKNDASAKDVLTKVRETSVKVMATVEAATKASSDLAHFLHVHGLTN